jgi:penicillin-binding protein 1A
MDYHTGEIKVIIGGRGNQPARSYNRAANNGSAPFFKPIGSAIKPISVYAATIDSKKGTAGTVVEDSPLPPEIGRQWPDGGKPWNPNNAESGSFQGYVTLREAIKSSINLVAIKQEYDIGLKTGSSYAEKFGLTLSDGDATRMSAMALGELGDGENTLSMAAAYGTFGNDGLYTKPRLYTKVVDRNGNIILETKTETNKILSPQSAYIMFDLLQGPTSAGGTAPSARFGSIPVGGKTGTSSLKKELWFCGVTPYLSGAVWIGHDKSEAFPKGISSSNAGQLWGKLMKEAHVGLSGKNIERPSGIRNVSICRESGKIPTDLCAKDQRGSQVYSEMFIQGTQPTTLCDVHVEAKVNKVNGKLVSDLTPPELIETRVFIKRDYTPTKKLDDQEYVLPTEVDDTLPAPPPPVTEPNNGGTDDGPNETEQPSIPPTKPNSKPTVPPTKPNNKPTVPPTKPSDSPNANTN